MKFLAVLAIVGFVSTSCMAHEPFWWHAYAYDADRMDTLDIYRLNTKVQQLPKDEAWLHLYVDLVHWYFANDYPDQAVRLIKSVASMLVDNQIMTHRPAYWYYGFLNLHVEKMTNRLDFRQALDHIVNYKGIPRPKDTCLPCMAIDFNVMKLMAKSGRIITDKQYRSIAEQFNQAYALQYTEIQGMLAIYLVYAKANVGSARINDLTVDLPTLRQELPPRPKARLLVSMAPKTEIVGIDSVRQFWRDFLALGGPKNLFALFRGNVELGISFEGVRQFDSAYAYYRKALWYAQKSGDLEAEVHALNSMQQLHQQYPAIPFPDSLAERQAYLDALRGSSSLQLRESMNDFLIDDLDKSNSRLSRQNTLITTLLIGVGVLLLGLSFLLSRLYKERKALTQANANKVRLYGMIAHDLRSPLSTFNSIRLSEATDREKMAQATKVINRLQWLLDDMLKWTFVQQEQLEARIEPTDIIALLEENLLYYSDLIASKHIQLTVSLQDDLVAETDPEMTSTILRNLIQNAIKHNYNGGFIRIGSGVDPKGVTLTIENSAQMEQPNHLPSLGKDLIKQFAALSGVTVSSHQHDNTYSVTLKLPACASG